MIKFDKNSNLNKTLKTNENEYKDIFDGDNNVLSEDGVFEGVFTKECEVFEIQF